MNLNRKPLATIADVANRLNISKVGVYRLVEQRKIPFYKVGRSLRFAEEDVEAYLSKNRIETIDRQ